MSVTFGPPEEIAELDLVAAAGSPHELTIIIEAVPVSLGSGGFTQPATVEPEPGGPLGQLYDLAADPAETTNLYLANPDKVSELTSLLERYQTEGRSRP